MKMKKPDNTCERKFRKQFIEARAKAMAREEVEHESMACMIATERVLTREGDMVEEDEAWRDL